MTTLVPTHAKHILDFIGSIEAPEGFDQYYGGIRKEDGPPRPLTQMTVGEVLAWQDSIDAKYRSEASGRFQVMEDTLRDLVLRGTVDIDAMFDVETQYHIGFVLMKRRGWAKFADGRISAIAFGNNLAKEWASLPVLSGDKFGRSYYGGDGLNHVLATPAQFMSVLQLSAVAAPQVSPTPAPKPKQERTHITQSKTVRAAGTQVVAGLGVATTAIQATEGVAQYMIIGGGILIVLFGLFIMRERIKKWADGIR